MGPSDSDTTANMVVPCSPSNDRGADGAAALTGLCVAFYNLELFASDSRE